MPRMETGREKRKMYGGERRGREDLSHLLSI
jgi:hypothetical protein